MLSICSFALVVCVSCVTTEQNPEESPKIKKLHHETEKLNVSLECRILDRTRTGLIGLEFEVAPPCERMASQRQPGLFPLSRLRVNNKIAFETPSTTLSTELSLQAPSSNDREPTAPFFFHFVLNTMKFLRRLVMKRRRRSSEKEQQETNSLDETNSSSTSAAAADLAPWRVGKLKERERAVWCLLEFDIGCSLVLKRKRLLPLKPLAHSHLLLSFSLKRNCTPHRRPPRRRLVGRTQDSQNLSQPRTRNLGNHSLRLEAQTQCCTHGPSQTCQAALDEP